MTNLAFVLTAYILPFWTAVGLVLGGPWLLMPLFNMYFIHPILDNLMCKFVPELQKDNFFQPGQKLNDLTDKMLIAYPFVQAAIIMGAIYKITLPTTTISEFFLIVLAIGVMTGGTGLTMAHELMHGKTKAPRIAGLALTLMSSYSHWNIEHVLGHHKMVGTMEDGATSRKNESLYDFLIRSVVMQFKSAYNLKKGEFLIYWGTQAVIYAGIIAAFGAKGIIFFLLQSVIAVYLLEHVNYIEHYGLERQIVRDGKYEKVQTSHSWDCYSFLTNVSMFNLGFHADHHAHINKEYKELSPQKKAMPMPYGFTTMMLIALFPKLWFKIMNPILEEHTKQFHFTQELIPEIQTHTFENKYSHLKEQVINQNLFRYLKFTQVLELNVINRFIKEILEQQSNHLLLRNIRLDKSYVFVERAFKIYEEEVEHADSVISLIKDVEMRSNQKSKTLDKPSSLNYLIENLNTIIDPKHRTLSLFSFVYVSETLISVKLSKLATDRNLYTPIRKFMKHHLKDEVKHSQFFGDLMIEVWPTLDQHEQNYLLSKIEEYKVLFLQPDFKAISYELGQLGVESKDIELIVDSLKAKIKNYDYQHETRASNKYLKQAMNEAEQYQLSIS